MPLFGRNSANTTQTAPPVQHTNVVDEPNRRSGGGFFGRHRATEPAIAPATTSGHHGGLLHRNAEDPSILAARERIMSAEAAERDADKALSNARIAVREAREHIKRLEREAAEE